MSDLTKLWRTKYGSDYDDMSDEELESAIVKKYPGQYDDLVTKPTRSTSPRLGAMDKYDTKPVGALDKYDLPNYKSVQPPSFWDKHPTLSKAADIANVPLVERLASPEMQKAIHYNQANPDPEHPYMAFASNLAGSLTSPASLGLGALTMGAGLAEGAGFNALAQGLELPGRLAGAGMMAHGGYNAYNAENTPERIGGLFEAGLGALGTRARNIESPLEGRLRNISADTARLESTGANKLITPPPVDMTLRNALPVTQQPLSTEYSVLSIPDRKSGTSMFNTSKFGLTPDQPVNPLISTVPNRLRPPSTNATVMDALVPERFKVNAQGEAYPLTTSEGVGGPHETVTFKLEQALPAEVVKAPEVQSIARIADESLSPEIKAEVSKPEFVEKYVIPTMRNTPGSKFAAKSASSVTAELTKLHPLLGDLVRRTRMDGEIQSGTWITRYDKIIKDISDKEFPRFVEAIEGKTTLDPHAPGDIDLIKAVNDYKILDGEVSARMSGSGAGLKSPDGTKLIPWQERENYWPHMYTEEAFKAMENGDLKARMMQSGMAPGEVDALFQKSKRFGERLIDAQHGRQGDIPGYRIDKEVYRNHLDNMAKRIKEAENYGPMDIVDPQSPLNLLIAESKNPEYASNEMSKLLGRNQYGDVDANYVTRKITALQAWMHLGLSALSNPNTITMIPIHTNLKSFMGAAKDMITASEATGEFARSSGAMQNIFREMFSAAIKGHKFLPTKVYGLDAEENFMRTMSSAAGKRYATELFESIKGGNTNPNLLARLSDLTLESPAKLAGQTELTDWQLKRAAFRTSELAQGLAEPMDLPHYWTGSGLSNILTLFHKYQFAQTKSIKNLILSNPVRNIPLLFGASQIAGELTGDAKALVKGGIRAGISGDPSRIEDELSNRQKFIQDKTGLSEIPARVLENMIQSFALGIYGDALEGLFGSGSELLKRMAGSAIGDATRLFDAGKKGLKGDFGGAATDLTGMIPIVGGPLRQELKQ